MKNYKNCKNCKKEYKRNPKYSEKQWGESKFCSRRCQYKGKDSSSLVKARKYRNFSNISGKNSHLWRGGITKENEKIRKSVEYKKWRLGVMERDNYTCQHCGKRGGDLQADHIKPFAYYKSLRFDLGNGRTLCKLCHRKTDTFGEKAKKHLILGKDLESYIETL